MYHACMSAYVCLHIYVYLYIYVHTCVSKHICAYLYICTSSRPRACVRACQGSIRQSCRRHKIKLQNHFTFYTPKASNERGKLVYISKHNAHPHEEQSHFLLVPRAHFTTLSKSSYSKEPQHKPNEPPEQVLRNEWEECLWNPFDAIDKVRKARETERRSEERIILWQRVFLVLL